MTTLISLVGSSPVPVYLGVREIPADRHILVASHSTKVYADRVAELLARSCPGTETAVEIVRREKDPRACAEQFATLEQRFPGPKALNFTGGSKAMVAAALIVWGTAERGAFYLDDRNDVWHGLTESEPERALSLSVDDVLFLHGYAGTTAVPIWRPPTEDLRAFAAASWNRGGTKRPLAQVVPAAKPFVELLDTLNDNRKLVALAKKPVSEWQEPLRRLSQALPDILASAFPNWKWNAQQTEALRRCAASPSLPEPFPDGEPADPAAAVARLLQGIYLEYLVHDVVRRVAPDLEVQAGVTLVPAGPAHQGANNRREVDLIGAVGNRLHFVSLTTSPSSSVAREKLYEVATVAHECGGPGAAATVLAPIQERNLGAVNLVNRLGTPVRCLGWTFYSCLLTEKDEAFVDALFPNWATA